MKLKKKIFNKYTCPNSSQKQVVEKSFLFSIVGCLEVGKFQIRSFSCAHVCLSLVRSQNPMVMDFVSKVTNTVAIWWYRFVTSCRALHALYYLPSEQVEAFLDSYNLFEQDNMNADDKQHQRIKAYYAVINHLCAIGIHNPCFLS